jgi:hypothetical protein
MLDVLDARIAPGFMRGATCAKSLRFTSAFSTIASITRSAFGTPSPFTSGMRRSIAACTRCACFSRFPYNSAGALDGGRDALRCEILQRHRHAAHRRPRGDVAAHGARADHVQVADRHRRLLAERLQPLLQLEDADEVARRRVEEKARVDAGCSRGTLRTSPPKSFHKSMIAYGAG